MIFHPVLNIFVLIVLVGGGVFVTVRNIVTAPTGARRWLWAERTLLVLLCFVMLLRPAVPGGQTQTLTTNTDILIAVDTTASIVAEDWGDGQPRLDGVRQDVQSIVDAYPGARFALITFDAEPVLRLPFTTDANALMSSIDVLRPEVTGQSRGSSVGIAAQLVEQTLRDGAEAESGRDRSRMLFYLGDGEQTVSQSVESFSGAKKYVDGGRVLGYGTAEGGPMKITTGRADGEDPGYIEYEGANAMSVIDETTLKQIGTDLGLEYEHRTADAEISLPDAPQSSTNYAEAGSTGNVTELFWIFALAVVGLLAFELARAAMMIASMRGLRATKAGER
ncbi:VWA domain-containing protein [Microbacterium sp. ZW T5_56]|uniref:VWA domain-containing protein n=1 Tax=Microbacterium sp. ZW T5_56 TaxID=3378081 RepID=UPI003854CE6B